MEAEPRSGSGPEAEAEPQGAESGPETKAELSGAEPGSRSGPEAEAEAEPLDFVVATEREFEEVLAISGASTAAWTTFPAATTAGSGTRTARWCWPSATEA